VTRQTTENNNNADGLRTTATAAASVLGRLCLDDGNAIASICGVGFSASPGPQAGGIPRFKLMPQHRPIFTDPEPEAAYRAGTSKWPLLLLPFRHHPSLQPHHVN
jgi:hypothetical protein